MSKESFGVNHLAGLPVAVTYALILAFAVIVLALLRHLFGSIRIDAGTH